MTSPQYSCVVKIFLIVVCPHFVFCGFHGAFGAAPACTPAAPVVGRVDDPIRTEGSSGFSQPVPVQRHAVDTAYHLGGLRVNHPKTGIVRVLYVAIGRRRKRDTGVAFHLVDDAALLGNVLGVVFVHNVFERGKIIFALVAVHAIGNGHKPHIMEREKLLGELAYARVSTSSEEQLTSYEAQVDYYTHFIQSKPEWEFVKVYTDEGISAVNTKKREGFNQMVQDALNGKIDLIVTKSVSRFARNTVDSLVTVRKLKEKGVEVYFEKENIYTLDSKGELLITIMSSLAQEESRSISQNVTWGQRKRFADGKISLPYSHFLGYRKGDNGLPEIVPEEAKTVRWIYSLFLSGKTTSSIANLLTKEGIPTPAGKKKWAASTVESILKNEKYKGDALLQKAFTVDFLTKKQKKNEGEVPQYWCGIKKVDSLFSRIS